jgi:serine/threonine protein phosphatase PrpC
MTQKNKLVCANVGDSRAFLFSLPVGLEKEATWKEIKMVELTTEHKP